MRNEKGQFVKGFSSGIKKDNSGEKNPMYGRKHSDKTKKKIGEKSVERKAHKVMLKNRRSYNGSNNPNWKDGKTKVSMLIRKCFKYRQWRSDIFTRDNFNCQECGQRGGELEAHHLKQFSDILIENNIKTLEEALVCEELWNLNNGQTLCKDCHNKTKKR